MASRSIPIILMGKTHQVGRPVAEHLKPEYEVIHFMTDLSVMKKDLPLMLSGKKPTTRTSENLGSENYSKPAEAVVAGAWFTDTMIEELRAECTDSKVPWATAGLTEEQRDTMMQGQMPSPEVYGPKTANQVKTLLNGLREEGKWGSDGVYAY